MFVPNKSQLANIDDEFNGIMVRGDCTGDVVFYGKGAGKLPTASAVVADVIDCCKHLKTENTCTGQTATARMFLIIRILLRQCMFAQAAKTL